jgi:hypothetical protein
MSDRIHGSWSRRRRFTAGGTPAALASHATILTIVSKAGNGRGAMLTVWRVSR